MICCPNAREITSADAVNKVSESLDAEAPVQARSVNLQKVVSTDLA